MAQGVTVDFNANVTRFTSSVDKMTNDLNRFQSNADRVSTNITRLFATLGVGIGIGAFTHLIKGAIDAQDELFNLSQKTGTAIKDLAGLKFAAEQNGSSFEMVARAGVKLSTTLAGNRELFAKFGITAKDSTGALIQIADIFKAMPDGVEKTALAVKLFGKAGADMIPFLNEGSAALAEVTEKGRLLNPVTEESAKQSKLFNDQLNELQANAASVGIAFTNKLIGPMNSVMTFFLDMARDNSPIDAFFDKIDNRVGITKGIISSLGSRLKELFGGESQIEKDAAESSRMIEKRFPSLGFKREELPVPRKIIGLGQGGALLDALGGDGGKSAKGGDDPIAKTQRRLAEIFKIMDDGRIARENAEKKSLDESIKSFNDFMDERREGARESANMQFEELQRWNDLADPAAKYREEIEDIKFSMQEFGGVSESVGNANIKLLEAQIAKLNEQGDKVTAKTEEMSAAWKTFADNTQRTLGEVLYKGFNGTFNGIGELFKQMLLRMAADAAAMSITRTVLPFLFSLAGGAPAKPAANGAFFDGGVSNFAMGGAFTNKIFSSPTSFAFANGGGFSRGLMGEAGPEAIIPLKRDSQGRLGVSGGGASINYSPVINIDSRTDRSEVARLVNNAVKQGNAELVDRLSRQGRI